MYKVRKIIFIVILTIFSGCSGTIKTVSYSFDSPSYKNAYIISPETSQYIKFKFGIITFNGYYLPPTDDPAVESKKIGNTDVVIKNELEKYGINAVIGKKGDTPEGFDLIVEYRDTWRWDFKDILDKLEIYFISPQGDSLIAKSTFEIYKNKEIHNFPLPEKEVPQMIKELLHK